MNNQPQQINASPEDLKGRFSNAAQVTTQPDHFVLDFFLAAPPASQLVSRIVISPQHMKALGNVILEQLKAYEDKFGKIDPTDEKTIGFRTQ